MFHRCKKRQANVRRGASLALGWTEYTSPLETHLSQRTHCHLRGGVARESVAVTIVMTTSCTRYGGSVVVLPCEVCHMPTAPWFRQ